MTDMNKEEFERLILAYEDLDTEEKKQADKILAERPDLRQRLESLRNLESAAAASFEFDEEAFWAAEGLAPGDAELQQRSLTDLRESLGLTVKPSGGFWKRGRTGLSLMIPVAAVLALLLILPVFRDGSELIRDLSVQPVALDTGGSRSGTDTRHQPGVLRSGEAFALDFHLNEDAYVLVFHVDPQGAVSLVHPASPSAPPAVIAAGEIRFPDPESGDKWILEGGAGIETFVVAAAPASSSGPETLALAKRLVGGTFPDVAAAVTHLTGSLSEKMEQVERFEFQHLD
ncbi:MAG: DUF4384 domain-containing protein [Candidatus Krumholzibacteriota bacterium]